MTQKINKCSNFMLIMTFDKHKDYIVNKLENGVGDRSRRGSVDKHIKELVELINSKKDYCTTSSCSGRTFLFKEALSGKRHEVEWPFLSHEIVNVSDVLESIKKTRNLVWFKFEPFILHISCRNISAASELVLKAHIVGLKRAGIISMSKKIIVEIVGNENLSAPIVNDNGLLVDESYLSFLVDEANKKMKRNHVIIEKLYAALRDYIIN